ncbi:hypothetical protein FHG87_004266 [Trinorchestia longiramus]|nr:hypothetical protein FHG87_004266 [Trinorchestia longiramus]
MSCYQICLGCEMLAAVSVTAVTELRTHALQYILSSALMRDSFLILALSLLDLVEFGWQAHLLCSVPPDTVVFTETLVNCSEVVMVAALDDTYHRQGFGGHPEAGAATREHRQAHCCL